MSDQSLASLDSLIKLITEKKVDLILSKQIEDEFYRNKNIDSRDFIRKLGKYALDIREPEFLKFYKGIKDLKKINKRIQAIRDRIIKEHEARISNPRSKINLKIDKIFKLSTKPDEEDRLLQRAYFRTIRGNPPRKNNNSFGDAIIWETILEFYGGEDMIIVSNDGDFASEIYENKINEFLEKEWKNKNGKSIKLFTNFGEFVNSLTKKQTIKKKAIEEEKSVNLTATIMSSGLGAISQSPNVVSFGNSVYISDKFGMISISSQRQCSLCKKFFNYDPAVLSLFPDRCHECQNVISGLTVSDQINIESLLTDTCKICGKAYRNDLVTTSFLDVGKCPDCRRKN